MIINYPLLQWCFQEWIKGRKYLRWICPSVYRIEEIAVLISNLLCAPLLLMIMVMPQLLRRSECLAWNVAKVILRFTDITSNIPWNVISRAPFNFETKAFSSCHYLFLAEWILISSSCVRELLPFHKCHVIPSYPLENFPLLDQL